MLKQNGTDRQLIAERDAIKTDSKIADLFNTNRTYVNEAQRLKEQILNMRKLRKLMLINQHLLTLRQMSHIKKILVLIMRKLQINLRQMSQILKA